MAIIETQTIESIDNQDINQLSSKTLIRSFGQSNDSIELTIFDQNGKILLVDEFFNDYTPYYDTPGTTSDNNKITSIDIDFEQVLQDYGYNSGKYVMNFSFQRRILTEGLNKLFYISEISPSRREIRIKSDTLNQESFSNAINDLSRILNKSNFIKDINLTFGRGTVLLALNALLDKDNTGLIKLYNPLPNNLGINSRFRIFEEVINPFEVNIQMTSTSRRRKNSGIDIGPPNFTLSNEDIFTVPSGYKTFDQILTNGAASSSFNNIQGLLSGSSVQIDLEFDNVDTPSGYHFENFIHFSSATERLRNFKYKLELLEQYSGSIAKLDNITGNITSSNFVTENKTILGNKQNKLIQGFDYYERYLYYESGAFAWPKTNDSKPFVNSKVNSAAAVSWFGAPIDSYEDEYYGGQMLSASKYDEINQHNLINTIPPHIKDNTQNDKYILFVEMIAQHFDGIWAYMDSITDINEAYSGLKDGISKDLVLNQLTSRGISAYDQFSNSSLYEYLIGDDGTGTFQFGTDDTATMISASNGGSIPKGDIAREIWKRLYHNSSYLLKTKGTERGLKALIACYGIPETVLHVKEYGGPLQDKTGFRTFSYQKESKMLSSIDASSADTPLASLNELGTGWLPTTRTMQLRFLPTKGSTTAYDIITLIDPDPDLSGLTGGVHDIAIGISQSIDTSKINSESFAHLVIASGSSTDAGGVLGITGKASSSLGPIFNGDVWNLSVRLNSGSTEGNTVEAFATNTTPNKNTYVLSCSLDATEFFRIPNLAVATLDETLVMLGNTRNTNHLPLLGGFTGSIQEYRGWTEKLTKATIVTQSLSPFNYNGNTISSSFEALYIRLPLGSTSILNNTGNSINHASNPAFNEYKGFQYAGNSNPTFIEETHHLPTPDTVGSAMVSDKVRIDNGTFDDNFLDPFISVETSPQDRQPLDYSDVGVFFSPTFEVNEDIIYTLGGFRLDDYIGDPTHYTSGSYPDLKTIRDIYTQKLEKKLGIGDYIRTIQFFDHTLFKMIKEFVPAKANLKTGLVIEPHYLERTKIAGTNVDYEQLTEHLAEYSPSGSITSTNETVHDVFIDVVDYIDDGSYSTAVENVAQRSRLSKKYFNSI
jgi:hypothetical protein